VGTWQNNESWHPKLLEVELWYQPIGFRWANNLDPYSAETRRFVYYDESVPSTFAIALARTVADR